MGVLIMTLDVLQASILASGVGRGDGVGWTMSLVGATGVVYLVSQVKLDNETTLLNTYPNIWGLWNNRRRKSIICARCRVSIAPVYDENKNKNKYNMLP